MMRAVQVAILAFACVAAGSLHAQDPAKASEAKQAERKLADVRAQIRQLDDLLLYRLFRHWFIHRRVPL